MAPFEPEEIIRQTFVRFVEYHPVLDSTNSLAADLRDELQKRTPALVLALEQTGGRGRASNRWWSSAGALTFSLVVDADSPALSPEHQPLVALAAGHSVSRTLEQILPRQIVHIKWPNDILVNDCKVCGILCERHTTRSGAVFIIGIGVNANNSMAAAPDDVRVKATSLYDLTGMSLDLNALLCSLLKSLETCLRQLSENPADTIREVAKRDRLHGSHVVIQTPARKVEGICLGIAEDGTLMLQTESGREAIRTGTVLSYT